MKKLFILLAAVIILCSCGVIQNYTFYQVYKVAPVENTKIANTLEGVVYDDANCAIMYSFWRENGNAGFTIYNKTDEMLVVDMNKSFFICNGLAINYNISSYSAEENDNSFRPIMAIPPKSYRDIEPQPISRLLFVDCDLERYPADSASFLFEEGDSPIHFTNYITYHLGNRTEEVVVENKFYIASVTNYAKPSLLNYVLRTTKPCRNKTTSSKKYYSPKYSTKVYDAVYKIDISDCFYIKYEKETDAKLYEDPMKEYTYDDYYQGYILRETTSY